MTSMSVQVEANEIEKTQQRIRMHRRADSHNEQVVSLQQLGNDVPMVDASGKAHLTEEQRAVLICKEFIKSRGGDESIADMDDGLGTLESEEEETDIKKAASGRAKKAKVGTGGGVETRSSGPVTKSQDVPISKPSVWNVEAVDLADASAGAEVDELFKGITQSTSESAAEIGVTQLTAYGGTTAAAVVYSSKHQWGQQASRPLGPVFPILGSSLSTSAGNNVPAAQSVEKQPKGSDVSESRDGVNRQERKRKKARGAQR